ncbi:MAG: hypothetical protein QOI38_1424 [Sphingomonadales bacterium]|jgi:hypothetical protein|nr:hypothetical protein [Sphingomonadales bacterium]
MRIDASSDETVQAALARIGRTEDVAFSPSGRRVAIAALLANRILLVEVESQFEDGQASVRLSRAVEIGSAALSHPHGLTWIGDEHLIVANREGAVTLFQLPPQGTGPARLNLDPILTIGHPEAPVITPGSLSVFDLGAGLFELLVCNNYVHTVSRHLLDLRAGVAAVATDILLAGGIDVPDGVAHSPTGRWLAVSNHFDHCVHLYRNAPELRRNSAPCGLLTGLRYAHGLRFSPDETVLVVADSGAPFVYLFRAENGDWEGERAPALSLKVMTDEEFESARDNPEEGGPKGLDLSPDGRLLALTCTQLPLAFFDFAEIAGPLASAPSDALDPAERGREAMLRFLAGAQRTFEDAADERRRADEDVRRMLQSRSWRITAPLRRIGAATRGGRA